jgi:hypothetical protein
VRISRPVAVTRMSSSIRTPMPRYSAEPGRSSSRCTVQADGQDHARLEYLDRPSTLAADVVDVPSDQ